MDKDKLIRNLPAMEAPTINSLSDGAVAIETIVPKNVMSDTIIVIKQGGGNILIQDITVTIWEKAVFGNIPKTAFFVSSKS